MVGVVAVGHDLGEFRLVESRVVESDRAGVDRAFGLAGHHRHHRAGIDAAGQEGAQRHFGDHAQAHGLLQAVHQLGLRVGGAHRVVEREAHVPELARLAHGLAVPNQQAVTGRQLARAAEHGARLGHVAERKVLFDRQRVDLAAEAPMGQQRLELRPEQQRAVIQRRVVHGLHAQAVARHEQALAVAVPQRKGEHAAQALDAVLAPGFPCVHDALGVALGVEHMAQGLQFRNQVLVVVDLAVEDDDDRAVFVEQRLLAGGHVDDRQPAVTEAHAGLDVQAAFVRAAVGLRRVHAAKDAVVDGALAAGVEEAGDAAHGGCCSDGTCRRLQRAGLAFEPSGS